MRNVQCTMHVLGHVLDVVQCVSGVVQCVSGIVQCVSWGRSIVSGSGKMLTSKVNVYIRAC